MTRGWTRTRDENEGPFVGTGDGLELAEGSGVENGDGLDKGQADCAGLHDGPSNRMFA